MDDTALAAVHTLVQTGWTLFAGALVLLMQAGFACLEAGAVRHKNSVNVALKNVVDFCAAAAGFFVVGYGLMFGASHGGMVGSPHWFLAVPGGGEPDYVKFFFQVTFCGTAATIVSGGIAERCRFLPYLLVSIVVSILIYPLFGHWVWGGGWLSVRGYHDFAGSSVVHMVGAGVTLAGIQVLGPRLGRFTADGRARALPSSSMPMMALGVLILLFGWIGFNGGSGPLGASSGLIIVNTLMAACFGGLGALLLVVTVDGVSASPRPHRR